MKISFDFDGTLEDEFGGFPINKQKKEIQDLAKSFISMGHQVLIVTRRWDEKNSMKGAKNEHVKVEQLAKELGISEIHFTNRQYKFSTLIQLNVDLHFENDEYEIELIEQSIKDNSSKCVAIGVERPNWRQMLSLI